MTAFASGCLHGLLPNISLEHRFEDSTDFLDKAFVRSRLCLQAEDHPSLFINFNTRQVSLEYRRILPERLEHAYMPPGGGMGDLGR